MTVNRRLKDRFGLFTIGAVLMVGCLALVSSEALAGSYTDKSYHDSGEIHTYKKPQQRSYTGPFDYGAKPAVYQAPAPKPSGRCNEFVFDATKSHDIDGQKLSVLWDFGDGTTSTEPVVRHVFDKPGEYSVTLTVKDSSGMICDTGVATTRVQPGFPPIVVCGEDKQVCLGETVAFDGSGTQVFAPSTYTWDFGDGSTGEGVKGTHTYEKPGVYRVILTVDDGKGTACSKGSCVLRVTVWDRVAVQLVDAPSTSCVGRTVTFRANVTGASKLWWDFGDGSTWEGGSTATHTYQKPGNYSVSVKADNGTGSACSVATDVKPIRVFGAPIANAGDNLACCLGKEVIYDGSKSIDPNGTGLSYHWDMGDGTTAEGARVTHTYQKVGNYRVVLTVKDSSGSECGMSSSSFVAVVNAQPEAIIEVRQ
jgi:PKD repeat protein